MGRKRVKVKVETKNFSGKDDHFSILFKKVTVKTKDGEKYAGEIVHCDYDQIVVRPNPRGRNVITYAVIAWKNVAEFIEWGWVKE